MDRVEERGLLPGLRDVPTPGVVLLAALLLLRTVLILLGDAVLAVLPGPFTDSLLYANVAVVVVDVVTLAVLALLLRRAGRSLRDLLRPFRVGRDLGLGLLLGLGLVVVFLAASFLANLVVYQGPPPMGGSGVDVPLWLGLWSLLLMPVTVAVAEECLYRGYLQHHLQQRVGRWPAVLVVAVFFGLQHAGLSLTSVDAVVARVLTTFLVGLVLGALVVWLRRLGPLVVAHWLLDVLGLGLPLLAAALV